MGPRRGAVLALLAGALLIPSAAAASSGEIRGLKLDPSLASATVDDVVVAFDGCAAVSLPDCEWHASAWDFSPPISHCPTSEVFILQAVEPPPRQVWLAQQNGDGVLHSGPLAIALGGVNDQHICLYASDPQPEPETGPALIYDPPPSTLLAEAFLHLQIPKPEPAAAPRLDLATAKRHLRRALSAHFRGWRKAERRRITCQRLTDARFRCSVFWRASGVRFRRRAFVWSDGSDIHVSFVPHPTDLAHASG